MKSRNNKEKTRATKMSLILFFAGVVIIIGNFFGIMAQMQKGEQISTLFLVMFIIGFFMVTVSLWTKFLVQNKPSRQ